MAASNSAEPDKLCAFVCLWCRDTRTGKTLAVVVAIDKTDDLAKAGFLGEPDFTPSDRQANINMLCYGAAAVHDEQLQQGMYRVPHRIESQWQCKFCAAPRSTACYENTLPYS